MRLKVLGGDEIDTLYGRPRFTHEERVEHFALSHALSPTEGVALEQLHSIKSKIFFILQLGYFKAPHMFFVFDLREVEEDVAYMGYPTARLQKFTLSHPLNGPLGYFFTVASLFAARGR